MSRHTYPSSCLNAVEVTVGWDRSAQGLYLIAEDEEGELVAMWEEPAGGGCGDLAERLNQLRLAIAEKGLGEPPDSVMAAVAADVASAAGNLVRRYDSDGQLESAGP